MSTNAVLDKYKPLLTPVTDDAVVMAMLKLLVEATPERQHDMKFVDAEVGKVLLFRHEQFPGKVLEYVAGTKEDSVTTLYEEAPVFESRASLIAARKEIYREIGALLFALPASVVVADQGRERADVYLHELGTAQMYDVLEKFARPRVLTLS